MSQKFEEVNYALIEQIEGIREREQNLIQENERKDLMISGLKEIVYELKV